MAKAKLRWIEGLQFAGIPPSNHAIILDGSEKGGGANSAIHPGELVLLALGGCTGMDVISILKKMRLEVSEFEVRIDAEAAQEHPKAWKKIKITYYLKGKDLPEEKVKHAIELSQEKYCSVSATLRSPVEIVYDHLIIE
ncbi:MAG: osmotically inducible protein OsmC [Planctomycetota bacterium]|nr:MAG: osmotically inducible protein OsmC [Planctomycetota bacterium]